MDDDLFHAIQTAISKGAIVVCAASNVGRRHKYNIGYPARFGNVLCIGSHTLNGQPSEFTSIGREVDFLAPGENIWSTAPNNAFVPMSGTSMATPFVSGLAALVLAYDRGRRKEIKNIAQMRHLLREMCSKSGHHDESSGYGTLDPMRVFRDNNYFYNALY